MCSLTDNIYDYYNVSQGKVTIPNMDDGEEFALTDVSVYKYLECNDHHGHSFILIFVYFSIPLLNVDKKILRTLFLFFL